MKNLCLKSYLFKRYRCKIIITFQELLENVALSLNVTFIHIEEYFLRFKRIDRIKFN